VKQKRAADKLSTTLDISHQHDQSVAANRTVKNEWQLGAPAGTTSS